MNEKPILFNAEMVRGIIAGHKTQTRRPIKPQPRNAPRFDLSANPHTWYDGNGIVELNCPFGDAGTLLWVRETHQFVDAWPHEFVLLKADNKIFARCTGRLMDNTIAGTPAKWRPSIHMPRWASRLALRVKRIWIERVQDINHQNALAEGIDPHAPYNDCGTGSIYRDTFAALWDSIYAKRGYGWDTNCYIWACEFEVVKRLEDILNG